jgi:hypothetical protein
MQSTDIPMFSITVLPLISTPFFAATAMAVIVGIGVAMTIAHGHASISSTRPLCTYSCHSSVAAPPITISSTVRTMTVGVQYCAKESIICSSVHYRGVGYRERMREMEIERKRKRE